MRFKKSILEYIDIPNQFNIKAKKQSIIFFNESKDICFEKAFGEDICKNSLIHLVH